MGEYNFSPEPKKLVELQIGDELPGLMLASELPPEQKY